MPADHPLASREHIEIAPLAGERILSGPPGCSSWSSDLRELRRQAGFDPELESRYRTVDFAALQAIVATGCGVTLVPSSRLPEHPGVLTRQLVGAPLRHVRLAALMGVPFSPATTALVELLQEAAVSRRTRLQPLVAVGG